MKTAVVFGARQPFGFEICSCLLEKGFEVYGIDHEQWISQEQNDNWLLIGRNANLRYMELKKTDKSLQQNLLDERGLFIIPILDYLSNNNNVMDQLVSQVKGIAEEQRSGDSLLVIQPPFLERDQSSYIRNFNDLLQLIKETLQIAEYRLPPSFSDEEKNMDIAGEIVEGQFEKQENRLEYHQENYLSAAAKAVVFYIEQNKMLEFNE